jgi:tetratricopeptide (TPR) repeat protein
MKWIGLWMSGALAVAGGVALGGCSPSGSSLSDETKEPHYLAGKSRVSSMDYKSAMEAFEEALEVNPRNSSAHWELACLLDQREPDPAAAIYHYEKYLKLRPGAENLDVVKQRIYVLKTDLSKTVMPLATTPANQREFERLMDENRQLRDEMERWRAAAGNRSPGVTNFAPVSPTPPPGGNLTSSRSTTSVATPSASRTHKVQAGDTPAAIARKYGIKLDALMAANPGLNPTRMQVGQSVTIPSP